MFFSEFDTQRVEEGWSSLSLSSESGLYLLTTGDWDERGAVPVMASAALRPRRIDD